MRSRQSTPARQRVWARSSNLPVGTTLALGVPAVGITNVLADYETVSGALVQGATIGGIRGWIMAQGSVSNAGAIYFGMKIGDRSFTGLPQAQLLQQAPGTGGRYDDWLYHSNRVVSGGPFAIPSPVTQLAQGEVIVRSKRKLPELNDTLLLFAEVPNNVGALTYFFDLSVLLLLP